MSPASGARRHHRPGPAGETSRRRRNPLGRRSSALVAHDARLLAVPVALLCRLALVVQLLALRQRDLQLGSPALVEIELDGNHGHALALDGDGQLVDLLSVQEEASFAARLVLEEAPGSLVLGNVGIDQPDAAVLNRGIALA